MNISSTAINYATHGVSTLARTFGTPALWATRKIMGWTAPPPHQADQLAENWKVRAAGIATLAGLQLTAWNITAPVDPWISIPTVLAAEIGTAAYIGQRFNIGTEKVCRAMSAVTALSFALLYHNPETPLPIGSLGLMGMAATSSFATNYFIEARKPRPTLPPADLNPMQTGRAALIAGGLLATSAWMGSWIPQDDQSSYAFSNLGRATLMLGTAAASGIAGGMLGEYTSTPLHAVQGTLSLPGKIYQGTKHAITMPLNVAYNLLKGSAEIALAASNTKISNNTANVIGRGLINGIDAVPRLCQKAMQSAGLMALPTNGQLPKLAPLAASYGAGALLQATLLSSFQWPSLSLSGIAVPLLCNPIVPVLGMTFADQLYKGENPNKKEEPLTVKELAMRVALFGATTYVANSLFAINSEAPVAYQAGIGLRWGILGGLAGYHAGKWLHSRGITLSRAMT